MEERGGKRKEGGEQKRRAALRVILKGKAREILAKGRRRDKGKNQGDLSLNSKRSTGKEGVEERDYTVYASHPDDHPWSRPSVKQTGRESERRRDNM